MESVLRYHVGDERFAISNPSVADIKSCIDAMDNDIRTWFTLDLPSGILSVAGGNQARFLVFFMERGKRRETGLGRIIDTKYIGSNEELLISMEGIVNHEPLRQTLPKEIAYQVATHFLSHNNFPEGLTWE